jgi:hypothetical protein
MTSEETVTPERMNAFSDAVFAVIKPNARGECREPSTDTAQDQTARLAIRSSRRSGSPQDSQTGTSPAGLP